MTTSHSRQTAQQLIVSKKKLNEGVIAHLLHQWLSNFKKKSDVTDI